MSGESLPYYTCPKCNGKGFLNVKFVKNNQNFVSVICNVCDGEGNLREDEFVYHV